MNQESLGRFGLIAVCTVVLGGLLSGPWGARAAEPTDGKVGGGVSPLAGQAEVDGLVDVRPSPPPEPWVLIDAPFGPATLFPTVIAWPWWQPLGHEIVPLGANGYVYRPIYRLPPAEEIGPPRRAADLVLPDADPAALMERAVLACRSGDYLAALAALDRLIAHDAADGYAHLLRAFALFMLEEHAAASEALHRALWTLPREEWGAVARNWQDYVPQPAAFHRALRRLEQFVRLQPLRPEGHFLLGYHYGYLGLKREAVHQLAEALELYQVDGVAPELLEFFQNVPPAAPPPQNF